MKQKRKYRITFNWHYELHTFYKWAYTPLQAQQLCYNVLAQRLKVYKRVVQKYFDGSKDNVKITEVV